MRKYFIEPRPPLLTSARVAVGYGVRGEKGKFKGKEVQIKNGWKTRL